MLLVQGSSQTGLFRHLSNRAFRNPLVRKYVTYEGHLVLKNAQNLIQISKVQKNVEKKLFVYEISSSELVALNCLF